MSHLTFSVGTIKKITLKISEHYNHFIFCKQFVGHTVFWYQLMTRYVMLRFKNDREAIAESALHKQYHEYKTQ